ncbi:DUF3795 domain-containing protein [Candidatus Bipolaricaulota bacterium]|nr:DUF3795 domain-containing protein [Candidatus Bipolaricaulota bacterium]
MLAYCGINCDTCPAYRGTMTTDVGLLENARDSFGDKNQTTEDWVCLGCTPAAQGFLATYCATCRIRTCAIEKGVQNCAACDTFDTCPQIHELMGTGETDLSQRMSWLRKRFLASTQAAKDEANA